jgi:hypothetical protein
LIDCYGSYTRYPFNYLRLTTENLEEQEKDAEEMFEKQNYIQACEKYYKISEEIVKALSRHYAQATMQEVSKRIIKGQTPWTAYLLNEAVNEIIINTNLRDTNFENIFRDGWRAAVTLHRECFHDFELTPPDISHEVRKIKGMIKIAKEILRRLESHNDTTGP